jgi:hypothetical protein
MSGAPVRPQTAVAHRATVAAARLGAAREPMPSGVRAGGSGIVRALGAGLA